MSTPEWIGLYSKVGSSNHSCIWNRFACSVLLEDLVLRQFSSDLIQKHSLFVFVICTLVTCTDEWMMILLCRPNFIFQNIFFQQPVSDVLEVSGTTILIKAAALTLLPHWL